MMVLCDCQTCAYCGQRLEDPINKGVKIILSSLAHWSGQEFSRSGTFYICTHCYAIKHWSKGELITGAELMANKAQLTPTKLVKKSTNKKRSRRGNMSKVLRYEAK